MKTNKHQSKKSCGSPQKSAGSSLKTSLIVAFISACSSGVFLVFAGMIRSRISSRYDIQTLWGGSCDALTLMVPLGVFVCTAIASGFFISGSIRTCFNASLKALNIALEHFSRGDFSNRIPDGYIHTEKNAELSHVLSETNRTAELLGSFFTSLDKLYRQFSRSDHRASMVASIEETATAIQLHLSPSRLLIIALDENFLVSRYMKGFLSKAPSLPHTFMLPPELLKKLSAYPQGIQLDPTEFNPVLEKNGLSSIIDDQLFCIPIIVSRSIHGCVFLTFEDPGSPSPSAKKILDIIVHALSLGIATACSYERYEKRNKDDTHFAEAVENLLVDKRPISFPGVELSIFQQLAGGGNGNWYHISEDPERKHLYLMFGDAANHGLPAAITAARADSFARAHASLRKRYRHLADFAYNPAAIMKSSDVSIPTPEDPAFVLSMINEILDRPSGRRTTMTMLSAKFDLAGMTVTIAGAGHDTPIFLPAGSSLPDSFPMQTGPRLGESFSAEYQSTVHAISPGDIWIFYSTGLVQCLDSKKDTYGHGRMISKLSASRRGVSASGICGAISADVLAFAGSKALNDDISVLVLKIL